LGVNGDSVGLVRDNEQHVVDEEPHRTSGALAGAVER
jgi:hypothetical protein